MSTPPTEASLRPDWDATITYDVLDDPAVRPGVFVGRQDLLRPLVAAVVEADKRGTMLVSGFRGSGKTTLVIEALRLAALTFLTEPEKTQPRLLPVVLNVSEVSTSLTDPKSEPDLRIDPRRLLIALVRAFRQRVHSFGPKDPLRDRIIELYNKATAADFKLAQNAGAARETIQTREAGLKIDSAELLKGSLFPAGLISLGLASLGAADGVVDQVIKGVAASGAIGAATAGVFLSRNRAEKDATSSQVELSLEHDNSQQEIENDLKDLLQQLREARWRTVVVLEELDKLDGEGEELDRVIRYFKNLFTQAPALFIFITDKVYFDRISRNIRRARRERSYAIEHTFFTHRMFVGRPSTADCLRFVRELLVDEADRRVVQGIYAGSGRLATESFGPRSAQASGTATPLSLFVRVLLFRASNHLFDLKAELQRFVDKGENGPLLRFDPEKFPVEDQVLAKFQDLLADKARTFEIKGGRGYANEVLHAYLAGVFFELGSASQRLESELLVRESQADDEDALEPGERRRVNEAVRSILDDLSRGGALRLVGQGAAAAIEWVDKPAEVFSLVRRLDEHEEKFAVELRRLSGRAEQLGTFAPGHPFSAAAIALAKQFADDAIAVSDLESKVSVDDALKRSREASEAFARLVAQAHDAVSDAACVMHSLAFESLPVGSREPGDGARLLVTADGDPRSKSTPAGFGLVVLAEGVRENMLSDVRALVEKTRPQRVAVVGLAADFSPEETATWSARWSEALGGLRGWAEGAVQWPRVRMLGREELGTLALNPATTPDSETNRAVLVLARELIAAAIWAVRPRAASNSATSDGLRVLEAVSAWTDLAEQPDAEARPILVAQGLALPRLAAAVSEALWYGRADAPWCVPLPRLSRHATLESPGARSELSSFLTGVLGFGPAPPEPIEARGRRVVDVLAAEPGIVVTDIEPPQVSNVLHATLAAHRWVMPDDGLVLRRIEGGRTSEARLDVTDARTPPGSTVPVKLTWGFYQPETEPDVAPHPDRRAEA